MIILLLGINQGSFPSLKEVTFYQLSSPEVEGNAWKKCERAREKAELCYRARIGFLEFLLLPGILLRARFIDQRHNSYPCVNYLADRSPQIWEAEA